MDITVKVKPSARKSRLVKEEKGILYLEIAALPEKGKANAEVERFLSKHTGKEAKVVGGFTSRTKRVRLKERESVS